MGKRGEDPDLDLWKRVVKAAVPLKKRGRASLKPEPAIKDLDMSPSLRPESGPDMGPSLDPSKQTPAAAHAKPKPRRDPEPRHTAREVALDRQTARHLQSGRRSIEARLDLHGLRQRDAHAALRRFLHTAQSKGHRHVLVITGKGASEADETSAFDEERRGVLRQAVPHWLGQPEFSAMVIDFAPAPRRLGGEGALYVRLRRARDRH
jgi:DNA-nicking Smr family endonuclease